ncbi:MAG TPA: glycosyltransferase family 4 protein [Thermoanaerobaculia bacterium]|nr:glycosyltransferase family 4 protein [Thermoanaerobaculia bacterium]
MKVLISSSRFPWPPYTGDRLRAQIWIEALVEFADVTLVSPPGQLPGEERMVRHIAARRGDFAGSLLKTVREELPLHALVSAGYRWREAIRRAESEQGPFDVSIVLLSRLHPWIPAPPPGRRTILDAIDSLTLSVEERAREARGPMRAFWRREVEKTRTLENQLGSLYDRVIVVNENEVSLFGPQAVAVPNGVVIEPPGSGERDYEFGFWGRLAYFANLDAARLLISDIWPTLRELEPSSRMILAGADAPREIANRNGSERITVVSPMENRSELLRRISIALFPVRYGTGQSNKILEAAEAGCAIIATPAAMRGLDHLAEAAIVEPDIGKFAGIASRLLRDPGRIDVMRIAGRETVERHYSREATAERLRNLVFGESQ